MEFVCLEDAISTVWSLEMQRDRPEEIETMSGKKKKTIKLQLESQDRLNVLRQVAALVHVVGPLAPPNGPENRAPAGFSG